MKKHAAFILCAVFLSLAVFGSPAWCDQQQPANSSDQAAMPGYPVAPAPAAPPEQPAVEGAYAAEKTAEPDSNSVLFDVIILRPAGLIACAAGLVGSIVAVPFSLISNTEPVVVKTLIVDPFAYTFVRPIGKY
jgi:hypothetical protein